MSNFSDFVGGAAAKWVSGKTYSEGKVVWSPADFQHYLRKTNGAGATDPSADTVNWVPAGARAFKPVQRGKITISTVASAEVTISPVNPLKTELTYLGMTTGAGATGSSYPTLQLVGATKIVAERTTAGGENTTVSWELKEWY